jgi:hypothetical protein
VTFLADVWFSGNSAWSSREVPNDAGAVLLLLDRLGCVDDLIRDDTPIPSKGTIHVNARRSTLSLVEAGDLGTVSMQC